MIYLDKQEQFDDWLNEIYPTVYIGIAKYDPAKVLKNCDEVTYKEWYWEWINNQEEEDEKDS